MKDTRWQRLCFCSREPYHDGTLSVVKAKCFWVICKKVDKAVDDDVAWSHGGVMSITFYNNVFLSLNFSFATRATGGEVREESLSIFSNGGMPSSHAGKASA